MKTSFLIGIALLIIDLVIFLILRDNSLIPKLTGITGGVFLLLAGLMVGAFIEPDSRRVDLATESRDTLKRRTNWSTYFLFISLPSLAVCITSFILIYW